MSKHLLGFLLFVLLINNSVFGQLKFQYGPKIGLTESYVHFTTNLDQNTNHPGLDLLGGVYSRLSYKKLEVQPEFFYQSVGGVIKTASTTYNNAYQYLTLPILVGYQLIDGLTLQAGPAYSWALNAGSSGGPDKNTDLGITAGIRIDMLDAFALYSLNFRYTTGIRNISSQIDSRRNALDYRNNIFEVSLSYNFSDYYKFKRKHKKTT